MAGGGRCGLGVMAASLTGRGYVFSAGRDEILVLVAVEG